MPWLVLLYVFILGGFVEEAPLFALIGTLPLLGLFLFIRGQHD